MKHYRDMTRKEQIRIDLICYACVALIKLGFPDLVTGYGGALLTIGFWAGPAYLGWQTFQLYRETR